MLLVLLLGWIVFSLWLAFHIARLLRYGLLKASTFVLFASLLVALPLADEIVGKFQFDQLCKEAAEAKIYARLPVGEQFYFPDGKWRGQSKGEPLLPRDESSRMSKAYESLIREDRTELKIPSGWMRITGSEYHLYNRKTGELLASFRIYGTSGGWFSRNFEKPTIVRDVCWPPAMGEELKQQILPFEKAIGE